MYLDENGDVWYSEEYTGYQLKELQQRIDKAIEYINNALNNLFTDERLALKELLNILQGSDKDATSKN